MLVESKIKDMGGGRDALTSQKNKKREKIPIGSSSPTIFLVLHMGKQKKEHKTCEEEYQQRGHVAILKGSGMVEQGKKLA
jgi:hypothetical protein